MNDRRSLVEGLTSSSGDHSVEEKFVYAGKSKATPTTEIASPPQVPEVVERKGHTANSVARVPLTTRVRSDFAVALKRASLQRQLNGVFPNTLQDILEDALEPWLRSHGFLN